MRVTYVMLFATLTALATACTPLPARRSIYADGWTIDTSLEKHRQCGMVRFAKGTYIEANLQLLVERAYLTQDQAVRAEAQDVRTGDPECVLYAAHGMSESLNTQLHDPAGRLTSIILDYRCAMSPIACPGQRFVIADGYIVSIAELKAEAD